ncbi:MAG TPA: hypothetical protein VMZ53_18490 [Kofleriaceae bacterium]|nr:hypothetical protein [Kofleriaceae bacterium]
MTKPMTRLILVALVLSPALAAADDAAAEYKRGQTALKAGRVHEACDAFAASAKLDAKIETELSLADCLEQDGKIMAAARLYKKLGEKDTDTARAKKSSAKATKLEAKAPRLRFAINPKPQGLVITVDGEAIAGTDEARVDIGPHEVVGTAPGFEGHASPAVDGSRPIVDVILRMEEKAEPAPPVQTREPAPAATPKPNTAPEPAPPTAAQPEAAAPMVEGSITTTSHRKRNGVVLTAAGAGLAIGAGVMLGLAASKFSTERELCPNAQCANEMDRARANALLDNGTTLRTIGIGVGVTGVALLAVGGYMLMTPDHESTRVSLSVGNGSTAVVFGGSF